MKNKKTGELNFRKILTRERKWQRKGLKINAKKIRIVT